MNLAQVLSLDRCRGSSIEHSTHYAHADSTHSHPGIPRGYSSNATVPKHAIAYGELDSKGSREWAKAAWSEPDPGKWTKSKQPNLLVRESMKTPATFERVVGEFRKQLVDSKLKEGIKQLPAQQLSNFPEGDAGTLYVDLLYSPYRPTFGVKHDVA